ncbi:MAG: hypothetical protein J6A79_16785 [Clostridia bacterium]|nr:hypothetical protein [Clostridia bacterium]
MRRGSFYPGGYREDEEIYVYDQSCDNCSNSCCPMKLITDDDLDMDAVELNREVKTRREEDAIVHSGEPIWCIYWQGGHRR